MFLNLSVLVLFLLLSSGMVVRRYSQERMAKKMAADHSWAMAMFSVEDLFLWIFRKMERGDRKFILSLMVHLYNYQTSQVGINQILNSFCEKNTHFNHDAIAPDANYLL